MLKRKGHTNAVDWWQLGCLAFELMCGHPPFESEDRKQLKAKIRKGLCRESLCRESLPACCADFILSLVQQDPRDRLAMRPGGIANVKDHNWFSKIDCGLMQQVKLPPPYVPVVNNKLDLRNFEVCAADAPKRVQYIDPGTGWDTGFATYA
jgi:serine/threonine protein kinase